MLAWRRVFANKYAMGRVFVHRRLTAAALAMGLFASIGCAGTEASSEPLREVPDRDPTTQDDAGASASPCEVNDDEPSPCVLKAQGRILDENGMPPVSGSLVSICGPVCYAGETDADGAFVVNIGQKLNLADYSTLLHDRTRYAPFYFLAPSRVNNGLLDTGELSVFTMAEQGPEVPELNEAALTLSAESGVTLELPAESRARFDFETLNAGAVGKRFRARRVNSTELQETARVPEEIQIFYALAPFETFFLPAEGNDGVRRKLRLSFPNDIAAPVGANLRVWALGSYLYPDYLTPALFEPVALARVSEDGTRIEMLPGEGVEILTWIGLAP